MVNAIQRQSSVVVQKSLAEGFGLTVAEGHVEGPSQVVASAVGGIVDQIAAGTGILLPDPADLTAFGTAARRLLDDQDAGQRGWARPRTPASASNYVGDAHLLRYARLLSTLIRRRLTPGSCREDRVASTGDATTRSHDDLPAERGPGCGCG